MNVDDDAIVMWQQRERLYRRARQAAEVYVSSYRYSRAVEIVADAQIAAHARGEREEYHSYEKYTYRFSMNSYNYVVELRDLRNGPFSLTVSQKFITEGDDDEEEGYKTILRVDARFSTWVVEEFRARGVEDWAQHLHAVAQDERATKVQKDAEAVERSLREYCERWGLDADRILAHVINGEEENEE